MPPQQEPNDDMKANKKVKVPLPKINLSTSEKHFSVSQLGIFVLVFAAIGGFILYKSFAASAALATVQAEAMSLPAGSSAINDSAASGGKAVKLTNNGSLSASFSLPSSATSLTVTARGDQCSGSPSLSVAVDGTTRLASTAVATATYSSYSATFNLASGTHTLTVSGANLGSVYNGNSGNVKCTRFLYVDVATFYGPSVTPPTVSLTPNPSTITSGSSSTLSWSSTNATSCSAPWTSSTATSGSQSVTPTATTTYSITCTGAGGSIAGSATVTVTTASGGAKLTWTPPGFNNLNGAGTYPTPQQNPANYPGYTKVTIPNVPTANSQRDLPLNDSTDYVVVINDYAYNNGIRLNGGRNVVVIGGRITINGPGIDSSSRTGLKLWPHLNTYYHVEGLQIRPDPNVDGGSDLHDGIALQGNSTSYGGVNSRLVLQNLRVGPTSIRIGETDAAHSDFFQNQAQDIFQGQIWMDRVTGLFDYSGIMLTDVSPTPLLDLRHVNMRKVDVNTAYQGHHCLYKVNDGTSLQSVRLNEFWCEPNAAYPFTWSFAPGPTATGTDSLGRIYAEWTGKNITGRAYSGVPASGDFAPASAVGTNYVSPGYQ